MKVEAAVFWYRWAVMGNKESTLPGLKYFILCSACSTVTVTLNHTVVISIIMIISVMIYRDINFLVLPIPGVLYKI